VRSDRFSQLRELGVTKGTPRLVRVRREQVERELVEGLAAGLRLGQDGRESATDAALNHGR
jgi:hypothetical protein